MTTQTTTRDFYVSACTECGSVKVTSDWQSALMYITLTLACVEDASTDPGEHYLTHRATGYDCWICCSPLTTVVDPEGLAGQNFPSN